MPKLPDEAPLVDHHCGGEHVPVWKLDVADPDRLERRREQAIRRSERGRSVSLVERMFWLAAKAPGPPPDW